MLKKITDSVEGLKNIYYENGWKYTDGILDGECLEQKKCRSDCFSNGQCFKKKYRNGSLSMSVPLKCVSGYLKENDDSSSAIWVENFGGETIPPCTRLGFYTGVFMPKEKFIKKYKLRPGEFDLMDDFNTCLPVKFGNQELIIDARESSNMFACVRRKETIQEANTFYFYTKDGKALFISFKKIPPFEEVFLYTVEPLNNILSNNISYFVDDVKCLEELKNLTESINKENENKNIKDEYEYEYEYENIKDEYENEYEDEDSNNRKNALDKQKNHKIQKDKKKRKEKTVKEPKSEKKFVFKRSKRKRYFF